MHADPSTPMLGKLAALIAQEKPALERQLALEVCRGGHPADFAAILSDPAPDELLVLAFVEGRPGFGSIGIASVRSVGAEA